MMAEKLGPNAVTQAGGIMRDMNADGMQRQGEEAPPEV